MSRIHPIRFLFPSLLLLCACGANPPRFADTLDELAGSDVVFLGEQHDNAVGHLAHREMLEGLHERRGELVLAMEMFERDVQPVLDRYLAGEIEEAEFLANSRPWPNYHSDYRPLIEFAKSTRLRVIAANAPRSLAKQASSKGAADVVGDPNVAAMTTAPEGPYRAKFVESMGSHPGVTPTMIQRFYEAQCLKDDTMAESIVRLFDGGSRPLVVHVAGDFHVADHLGTVERVRWRRGDLKLAVVSMPVPEPQLHRRGRDTWEMSVPVQLPTPPAPKPAAKPAAESAKPVAEEQKEAKPEPVAEEPEAPQGRPALGFMPDYESGDAGVRVTALRPGGPAETAGLREGDVIVKIGDQEVGDVGSYMEILGNLAIGKKIEVTVKRGEETKVFDVVVGERIQ